MGVEVAVFEKVSVGESVFVNGGMGVVSAAVEPISCGPVSGMAVEVGDTGVVVEETPIPDGPHALTRAITVKKIKDLNNGFITIFSLIFCHNQP